MTTHGTVLDVVDDLEQVLVLLGAPLVFVDMTENSEKSQHTVIEHVHCMSVEIRIKLINLKQTYCIMFSSFARASRNFSWSGCESSVFLSMSTNT